MVERSDLSIRLNAEPVSLAPALQGQASPGGEDGKPRRRPPPPEKTVAEPEQADGDELQHRIDSLA